ncbi:hypothetical protein [Paenibacillus marchantiophytorum]|uniref:hypothetical protein n=1 Tax=Paenibacillus marchantiophytorum TaxID=1619310 RepID=UPI00166EBCA0|nr:hypothetical protein [Paenibacillus marchantiophytorum]
MKATPKQLDDYGLISRAFKQVFRSLNAAATSPERCWRMPTAYNVIYQNVYRFTIAELKEWVNETFETEPNTLDKVMKQESAASGTGSKIVFFGVMDNPAIKRLLKGVPYGLGVRNKTTFSLALLFRFL